MAMSKMRLLALAIFMGIGFMVLGSKMALGQCQGDVEGLIKQCSRYVQRQGPKIAPSPDCCGVVKTVDLPCVCQHITKDVEQIVSMKKAVYVAKFCGKPLAHGTKCGSYIVP